MTLHERQTELDNCRFCKAVLMVLIVLYHVILPWANQSWAQRSIAFSAPFLKCCSMWLNSFHIYAFTLASGYIYAFLKLENGRYKEFTSFVKGKIKRLIVPLVCVTVLWVGPIEIIVRQLTAKQLVEQFVLMENPGQLWFLLMLFGVFVIFYLLTDFFTVHDIKGLIVALAFYGVGTVCNRYIDNYFQIWNTCRYVIFFWIGFKIRQKGSVGLNKILVAIYIAADAVLFAVTYLLPTESVIWQAIKSGMSMLLYVTGAITAFVVLQYIANRVNWKDSKIASTLIKYSMPVYLIHQQVSYLLTITLNGVISPYIQVAINFVFTMLVSLALSAFLYKFKLTRKLLGEKA